MKFNKLLICGTLPLLLASCETTNLVVPSVKYQSVRTTFAQPDKLPENAQIGVEYFISSNGVIQPIIYNLTDEIMVIDQTKSFIVNTNGTSTSYFDPTVRTETTSVYNSTTNGASMNLGGVARAFNINGAAGSIMRATNVGTASTSATTNTSTVMIADQPKVNIGPRGSIAMSKQFKLEGVGRGTDTWNSDYVDASSTKCPLRFSITVTYSADNGVTFQKLITNFYVSSNIVVPVSKGIVSDAFASIYQRKPDALVEPVYMFLINSNLPKSTTTDWYSGVTTDVSNIYDTYTRGSLVDWQ